MRKIIALAAVVEFLALSALAVQAVRLSGGAETHLESLTQSFGPGASVAATRAVKG